MKQIIIWVIVIVLVAFGIYYVMKGDIGGQEAPQTSVTPIENIPTTTDTATIPSIKRNGDESVIGTSVEGREIKAYHFGSGAKEILFVGGIHGGYEWNTTMVAYELISYLKKNPTAVSADIKVTVIPVLNPDGLFKVVGTTSPFTKSAVSTSESKVIAGRFNANQVDLNRNFDCDWQATGKWQDKTVSGGIKAFSEPESSALKTYVAEGAPTAVVAWYSAAGGVYASSCASGISSETRLIMNAYANASGYPAYDTFDSYEVTGDMVNWFAKNNIPAISVLLTNHTDTEWQKNEAGIKALLSHFSK